VGIYNRKDSKYWWMFLEHEPDPKKRRQSTGILKGPATTKSRDTAEAVYQATDMRLRGIAVGIEKPPDTMYPTFDVWARWVDTNILTHHKGVGRERDILRKHLQPYFGTQPINAIGPGIVAEYRGRRLTHGTLIEHFGGRNGPKRRLKVTAKTVNREVDVLQQVLQYAAKYAIPPQVMPYFTVSPLAQMKDLETTAPVRGVIEEGDDAKLVAQLKPIDCALWYTAQDTLARISDVLDIQRGPGYSTATHVLIADPKNREGHWAPISPLTRQLLDGLPIDPADPTHYFAARRKAKNPLQWHDTVNKVFHKAAARAQVPYGRKFGLTTHWATRRTGATRVIDRSGERGVAIAQKMGNWRRPDTLQAIYQHVTEADLQEAVKAIGAGRRAPLTVVGKKGGKC
jgi:integrase